MDYSPPGSSIHGISQARIVEWVAISFSEERFFKERSSPRNTWHGSERTPGGWDDGGRGCFSPSSHTLVSPLSVPWVGIPHGPGSWHWPPTAPQTANAKISRHVWWEGEPWLMNWKYCRALVLCLSLSCALCSWASPFPFPRCLFDGVKRHTEICHKCKDKRNKSFTQVIDKTYFVTKASMNMQYFKEGILYNNKWNITLLSQFSSVAQSCQTLCDPMNHSTPGVPVYHQLPEFTQTHAHSSRWCHPAISSSVVPFSPCPRSLPASGSFPMSQLFTWGGQSIGVSPSASVLPMNTQDWSPSGWTG